jgi:hypothetical protein
MENMNENYSHIKGWGIDADPENEPTYPMKRYTGDDHRRLHYERVEQQPVDVEILQSNERPSVTSVFGTSTPPSGLSGMIRRFAFRYCEGSMAHWLPLIIADRVNTIEAIIEDIGNGHFPNIVKERGWIAEWKYNKKNVVRNVVIGTVLIAGITILLFNKNKMPHRSRLRF